ncbi:DHHC palmitoyltransferase-domain-containing protein [Pelagophyceae sp. CCMP2097]|nr:DHHC palmitoyltransferase-domain-containing protein [Pelagophyceae sp. CCMP2097]
MSQATSETQRASMSPMCGTSHNARCWLCTDSCGLCCAAFTYAIILFSQSTVTRLLFERAQGLPRVLHLLLFNAVAGLALAAHLKVMLSDPGAVPKHAEPLPGDAARLTEAVAAGASQRKRAKGWCHRCSAYKPPRAHHDSVTGRCIVKLDHYCPWANNAIGVRNHKFFLLFIWYTFVLCVYALAILIAFSFASVKRLPRGSSNSSDLLAVAQNAAFAKAARDAEADLSAAAFVVGASSVLFGLFTSCMLCDQWSVVQTHVAKIDRLKGDELSVSNEVNEVFGGRSRGFALHWLLPTDVFFPQSVHDDVMGFRLPRSDDEASPDTGLKGPQDDPDPVPRRLPT